VRAVVVKEEVCKIHTRFWKPLLPAYLLSPQQNLSPWFRPLLGAPLHQMFWRKLGQGLTNFGERVRIQLMERYRNCGTSYCLGISVCAKCFNSEPLSLLEPCQRHCSGHSIYMCQDSLVWVVCWFLSSIHTVSNVLVLTQNTSSFICKSLGLTSMRILVGVEI